MEIIVDMNVFLVSMSDTDGRINNMLISKEISENSCFFQLFGFQIRGWPDGYTKSNLIHCNRSRC